MSKKWYNNGLEQRFFEEGCQPENYILGRLPFSKEHCEKLSQKKSGLIHINNGSDAKFVTEKEFNEVWRYKGYIRGSLFSDNALSNIRKSRKEFFKNNPDWVSPTSWKHGHDTWNKGIPMSEETRRKLSLKVTGRKLSEESRLQKIHNEYITKKKNNSFHVSSWEDICYRELVNKFGEDDVIRQYQSKEYPFNCDFYISTLNLYIELQFHWTHGKEPFDIHNPSHLKKLEIWKEKSKKSKYYKQAINVWTIHDIKKLSYRDKVNIKFLYNREAFYDFLRTV